MQIDAAFELRRLAEEYRAKSDEELRELAADFTDLTEPAQQALRQEMQIRRLGDPQAPEALPPTNAPPERATARIEPEPGPAHPAIPLGLFGRMPELIPDAPQDADEKSQHEYTWKTALCDCDTNEEALQLSEVLHQSGIDSWIQQAREFGRQYARVQVAADQLEQARAIAARSIPKEIIDESKVEIPEFVEPKCPKCGSDDVVLEGVDPENTWRCEQCGAQWTDPAEVTDAKEERAGELPS